MANVLIQESTMQGIASAIRQKAGVTTAFKPAQMISAIKNIPSGGGGDDGQFDAFVEGTMVNASGSASYIKKYAFYQYGSLQTVSFPNCLSIGSSAFHTCSSLQTASFPNCSNIGSNAFIYCRSLQTADFPSCSNIEDGAFCTCDSLQTVSFPNCSNIGSNAFASCFSLQTASFPNCSNISSYAFAYCRSLQTADFPNCLLIRSSAFLDCRSLQTADFPNCLSIRNSAFYACYNLVSLYLNEVSQVTVLPYSSAFGLTPIAGYTTSTGGVYGSVFVPLSLETAFKTAFNWSYFSERIVGI